jgi:hypothetical protein
MMENCGSGFFKRPLQRTFHYIKIEAFIFSILFQLKNRENKNKLGLSCAKLRLSCAEKASKYFILNR